MTVVLVDRLRPSLVPVEAITLLAGDVQYTEEMPVRVPWSLPAARPSHDGEEAPVLLSSDPEHPLVVARVAAGEQVIRSPGARSGERLVDAVALMDTLRTSGPWEREQTHDSLRRYLLEETYELFDAIRSGDAQLMREELGDVLLQVLFHARIAEDDADLPFGIDDVADALVRKLVNRAPGVLGGQQISLDQQLAQWEERKALEKSVKARTSCMDDVPTGQPALALTQKVYDRAVAAGLPVDLIPGEMASVGQAPGGDPETALRSTALEFVDMIRTAERSIAAGRRGEDVPEELYVAHLGTITADEWRAHWPGAVDEVVAQEDSDDDAGDVEVAEAEVAEAEAAESDDAVASDAELGDAEPDEPGPEPEAEPHDAVAENDSVEAPLDPPATEDLESLEPIPPEESAEAKARAD